MSRVSRTCLEAVAEHLARGETDAQIAAALCLTGEQVRRMTCDDAVQCRARALIALSVCRQYARAVALNADMMESGSDAVRQKAVHEALSSFEDAARTSADGSTVIRFVNAPEVGEVQ